MENLFVSGYITANNGNVGVIVKDVVAKNPLIRVKCKKSGTFWTPKGTTIEEAKSALPLGTEVSASLAWGEELKSEFGGLFSVTPILAE